jgi:signal transduction histidine kinase
MRVRNKALFFLLVAASFFLAMSIVLMREFVSEFFEQSEEENRDARSHTVGSLLGADLERLGLVAKGFAIQMDSIAGVQQGTEWNAKVQDLAKEAGRQQSGLLVTDGAGKVLFASALGEDWQTLAKADSELLVMVEPISRYSLPSPVWGMVQRQSGLLVALGAAPLNTASSQGLGASKVIVFYEFEQRATEDFWQRLGFRVFFSDPKQGQLSGEQPKKLLTDLGARISRVKEPSSSASSRAQNPAEGESFPESLLDPREATIQGEVSLEMFRQDWESMEPEKETLGFLKSLPIWMFPQFLQERDFVLNASLLSSVFIIVVVVLLVYAAIGKWLATPLEDLAGQIRRMTENPTRGDRLQDPKTDDEFDQLTASFNALLERLEATDEVLRKQERLALLGTMQAEFAHEVANPLAALVSYSRRVSENLAVASKAEDNKRHLEKTVTIGNYLIKLLHSFRSASREGTHRSHWQIQDISSLLDVAYIIGGVKAKKMGVALELSLPSEPAYTLVDASQIVQVLNNVISNAIDAAALGKSAPKEKSWVRVQCMLQDQEVIIRVVDSGPGISPHMRARLFQRFATTKAAETGTGLGLSLSSEVVRAHGGQLVLVENEAHTTFDIHLPQAQHAESSAAV